MQTIRKEEIKNRKEEEKVIVIIPGWLAQEKGLSLKLLGDHAEEGVIKRETEKALLLEIESADWPYKETVWLPKSQVEIEEK